MAEVSLEDEELDALYEDGEVFLPERRRAAAAHRAGAAVLPRFGARAG